MFDWPTFVLDLANNHGGSVERGLDIIRAHAKVVHKHGVRAAIKLQLRDLGRYQHGDAEYSKKFEAAIMGPDGVNELIAAIEGEGLQTCCTAFDPSSAERLVDFDIAKVASCSAKDTETLAAIVAQRKPTIISTGGLRMNEIKELVERFKDRVPELALLHCVSLYPTPLHRCDLIRIGFLLRRFSNNFLGHLCYVPVGWSTHEDPDAEAPVMMAVAYGATIFERHIGLGGNRNGYSSSPEQLDRWISNWKRACAIAGEPDRTDRSDELAALRRVARQDCYVVKNSTHRIGGELEGGAFTSPRP